ncbi:MAG: glycoside hydrolase family 78 protein [Planctomycetota bacterium]
MKLSTWLSFSVVLLVLAFTSASASGQARAPESLRCEYLVDPLAIDTSQPRFSWEVTDSRRGAAQTAYQVLIASDAARLEPDTPDVQADIWDSGKVLSSRSIQVAYGGQPLRSGKLYYWWVRTWDQAGESSPWSGVARFGMGLLDVSDWRAQWIGDATPAPPIVPAHNGYHSALATEADTAKWVVIDLAQRCAFDRVKLYPARPFDWREDVPAFLYPVQFRVDVSDEPDFGTCRIAANRTRADESAPPAKPRTITFERCEGRYVRLWVEQLAARAAGEHAFALAEMQVLDGEQVLSSGCAVTALDSIEESSWSTRNLTDGDLESHRQRGLHGLPAPLLRKSFTIGGAVKRAVVYVAALGAYELHINATRVGDHILAPEWTDYKKRVQYQAFDVTALLRGDGSENVIGALLGDGWYAGRIGFMGPDGRAFYGRQPRLLAQLQVELADGRHVAIVTDGSWRSTLAGPVRSSDVLAGEEYDARLEMPGWDSPGFDDSSWQPVAVEEGVTAKLVAQPNPPIRVVEELHPIAMSEPEPGVYVLDFGQNMVGWVRLRVRGEEGTTVTLRHAEMLEPETGAIYTTNLRAAEASDRYILGSSADAFLEPHFTYHGFRYVEVRGLSEKPALEDFTGRVFCSSCPQTGSFECSSALVNRLFLNILWTQRANLTSTPTDCPQRDERLGWMGDILAFSQNAIFNMDMAAFFTKWVRDVRDAQTAEGRYPDFAPQPFPDWSSYGVPGWADAGVVVPWRAYVNYNDSRLLAEHYNSARRWIDVVHRDNPEGLWRNARANDYGDWLNGDTLIRDGWPRSGAELPKEIFATLFFAHSTELVSKIAGVLGKSDEEKRLVALRREIESAFNRAYVDEQARIQGDTQAGYALALHFGLLPEERQAAAFEHLVGAIERYNGHLSTGFHSTQPMMHELTQRGRNDLAYQLLCNRTFPSWGYTIENGATTIWERWDGFVAGRGFQDPGMNSFNHYALGSVGEWIYRTILGINPDESHPAYEHIIIHPRPGGELTWARGSYHSIRGEIGVDWRLEDGKLVLLVTIPPNTTATVSIPTRDPATVTEGGRPVAECEGITASEPADGAAVYRVGSGRYEFVAAW